MVLVLALSTITRAETYDVQWAKQMGSGEAEAERGYGVAIDDRGNLFITGYTTGDLFGTGDMSSAQVFLMKLDNDGNQLWTKQFGSEWNDYGYDVAVDDSGNAYATGYVCISGNTHGSNSDNHSIFLTKYDTNGTCLWMETLGDEKVNEGYGVTVDGSGNAYVTGKTYSDLDGNTSAGSSDAFFAKYDTNGTKLWTKQMGTSGREFGSGVAFDGNGHVYVSGSTTGNLDGNTCAGEDDAFLTKYTVDGTKLWTKLFGTSDNETSGGVAIDGNGYIYLAGHSSIVGEYGQYDGYLAKYDAAGNRLWTSQWDLGNWNAVRDVAVDSSGNAYVVAGNLYITSAKLSLTKFDTSGNKLWNYIIQTNEADLGDSVCIDDRGIAYVVGSSQGNIDGTEKDHFDADIVLAKISNSSIPLLIPGDANCDGKVDASDVTILADNWQYGSTGTADASWSMGDFNDDGKVDGSDVTILADNWQYNVNAMTVNAVPEPSALVLLSMASMAFLFYRRCR